MADTSYLVTQINFINLWIDTKEIYFDINEKEMESRQKTQYKLKKLFSIFIFGEKVAKYFFVKICNLDIFGTEKNQQFRK